jgi:hypothetical protein
MELQTKFIEGTCRQYSIREDGAVFRNYVTKVIEGKEYAVYKKRTRRKTPGNCINLSNYKINTSLKILIFNHFGYCICKKCNKKVDYLLDGNACKECIENSFKIYSKTYYNKNKEKHLNHVKEYKKNNVEKCKAQQKIANAKSREKIPKYTASQFLKIPPKDIPNELLNEYRTLVKYKREIAKKYNVHIHSIR